MVPKILATRTGVGENGTNETKDRLIAGLTGARRP
jgi:hypothetical protein